MVSTPLPTIHPVGHTCKMIDFARSKVSDYEPKSGTAYFQLTEENVGKECISAGTEILLINGAS